VVVQGGVRVIPDDLAGAVDAVCKCAVGTGIGIVDGGENATAFEEAVEAAPALVDPDDLVRTIDPERLGGAGEGGGIVERVEDIDWHDTGSSVIVPLRHCLNDAAQGGAAR
jgi:hypothetical protein